MLGPKLVIVLHILTHTRASCSLIRKVGRNGVNKLIAFSYVLLFYLVLCASGGRLCRVGIRRNLIDVLESLGKIILCSFANSLGYYIYIVMITWKAWYVTDLRVFSLI